MSSEQNRGGVPQTDQVRRRGDRRINDVAVPEDRRKADRRETPGVAALFRTLFRREASSTDD